MDSKLKRIYVPMTETGFYILFCLQCDCLYRTGGLL